MPTITRKEQIPIDLCLEKLNLPNTMEKSKFYQLNFERIDEIFSSKIF